MSSQRSPLAVIKYGTSTLPLKAVCTETVRPWEFGVDVVIVLAILRDPHLQLPMPINEIALFIKLLTRKSGLILAEAETWILFENLSA